MGAWWHAHGAPLDGELGADLDFVFPRVGKSNDSSIRFGIFVSSRFIIIIIQITDVNQKKEFPIKYKFLNGDKFLQKQPH